MNYAERRHDRGVRAAGGHRRAAGGKKAALKTTEAVDPPATTIFTPDTEFGSRFLVEVVRGCANLCRFCWAGYNYLPVRAFPTERILAARRAGAAALRTASVSCRSRCATTPTSRRSSRGLLGMGYSISPASLRLDDLTPTIVRSAARTAASGRSRSRRKPDPTGCAA